MAFWHSMLSGAQGAGSRSSALAPLYIPFGIVTSLAVYSGIHQGPEWLTKILAGGSIATGGVLLGAYVFLLFRDRDALRSERFALKKLEYIERMLGDNKAGLHATSLSEFDDRPRAVEALPLMPGPEPLEGRKLGRGGNSDGN